jgi:hypothetical protein
MVKIVTIILLVFSAIAHADPPVIVDGQIGKFLGTLSLNSNDPNSVSNPYGRYGSQYSPDSINNPVGKYGSPYSDKSINNPYATNPPIIIDPDVGDITTRYNW